MNDKTMRNLQIYIGKRSLGQSDTEVIEHIQKIELKEEISQEEWKKLAYPCCATPDLEVMKYILCKIKDIDIAKELILHTVRFRQKTEEYQLKQVQIVKALLVYIDDEDKESVLNNALVNAAWFGEYEVVKLLVEEGAKPDYVCLNGRNILELSQNAVEKFGDSRGYDYIMSKIR